jgi:general transcription factor 3C polypeptide 3 (transcription factor C subunit 4)
MNRRQPNRHSVVIQAFSFLFRYYELSNRSSDASYNVARAFHQLELYHLAVPYYKQALEPPTCDTPPTTFVREAAFNLALIYRKSGAPELARQLMIKHLTF